MSLSTPAVEFFETVVDPVRRQTLPRNKPSSRPEVRRKAWHFRESVRRRHISVGVDGRFIGPALSGCQRPCESFLTVGHFQDRSGGTGRESRPGKGLSTAASGLASLPTQWRPKQLLCRRRLWLEDPMNLVFQHLRGDSPCPRTRPCPCLCPLPPCSVPHPGPRGRAPLAHPC